MASLEFVKNHLNAKYPSTGINIFDDPAKGFKVRRDFNPRFRN